MFARVVASSVVVAAAAGLGGCVVRGPMTLSAAERASEATLVPGDRAPSLAVSEWVKGEPVGAFEPGTVYVIDFWATWCAPCLAIMPRLSELADRHGGRVVVVGLATVDRASTPTAIRRTVRRMDERMRFRVAIDDGTRTSEAYRRAARETALPRTFIVDGSGRLAWIGHPMHAEPVVEAVLAGTWDVERAGSERREALAQERRSRELWDVWVAAYERKDAAAQLAALEESCRIDPERMVVSPPRWCHTQRVQVLVSLGRMAAAAAGARESAAMPAFREDALALAELGWSVWEADAALAGELADRAEALLAAGRGETAPADAWEAYLRGADAGERSPAYAGVATVRWRQGRKADAVAAQRRALEGADERVYPDYVRTMRATLEAYERGGAGAE